MRNLARREEEVCAYGNGRERETRERGINAGRQIEPLSIQKYMGHTLWYGVQRCVSGPSIFLWAFNSIL